MSNIRRATTGVLAAVALAASLAGCSSGHHADAAPKVAKVTYLTNFGASGRDSYAYVAKAKGFFRDANLDVDIQPGAAGQANLKSLYSPAGAQFAVVDFATAAQAVANGEHPDLRVLAAIQQRTVSSIISLPGRGISQDTPRDLIGKRIGTVPGSVLTAMFTGYANLAHIDPNSVHWVNAATPQALPAMLVAHQVDAIAQYSLSAPSVEHAAGCTGCAVVLHYDQYVGDPYGAVLVTTTGMIDKDAGLVHRFVGALMQGLQATIDDPKQAGAILHAAVPTTDADSAAAEVRLMKGYVTATTSAHPIGSLDPERVARAIASLQSIGLYPPGLTPDGLVAWDLTPHLG